MKDLAQDAAYYCCMTAIVIYGWWLAAWAFVHMWAWHVVPQFGLPEINKVECVALLLILRFTHPSSHCKREEKPRSQELFDALLWATLKPLAVLGALWCLKHWLR